MHLVDILSYRPIPAAGVFLGLTRRCPLSCAHCSTNSSLESEEHAEDIFVRFAESFTAECHPDVLLLSGGEALLRPKLVLTLTRLARRVGTRVYLISGMFFARSPDVPSLIDRAVLEVDHFSASLDTFHETQVPRSDVFRALRTFVDRGQDVSIQVVGLGESDPYILDVTTDIRRTFGDRVPVLVGDVGAVGRAKSWLTKDRSVNHREIMPLPCTMAAWPVVAFDGTIVACCNQVVVDGPAPAHLRLGHAAVDGWPAIRERCLASPMMRAIRVLGPEVVAQRYGGDAITCDGYCSTCLRLSDIAGLPDLVEQAMDRLGMRVIEAQVAELQRTRFPHGLAAFEHLRWLGYDGSGGVACAG